MKNLVAALLTLILLLAAASSTAMAASGNGQLPIPAVMPMQRTTPNHNTKSPGLHGHTKSWDRQKDKKIYFSSFDGTYLHTTAGPFYMPSATLVNHSGEDLRQIKGVGKKMEVKLTIVDRKVTQADVYPDGRQ